MLSERPGSGEPIHVLLALRHRAAAIACATQLMLESRETVRIRATAIDEALDGVTHLGPEVLVLEHPGDGDPFVHGLIVRATCMGTRVLVLWEHYSATLLAALVSAGASGCLPASSAPAAYLAAIDCVRAGQCWFERHELLDTLRLQLGAQARPSVPPDVADILTPREREILAFVGDGLTNKEIARRLAISDHTVKTHLHRVYVKLESSGRFKAYLSGARERPYVQ